MNSYQLLTNSWRLCIILASTIISVVKYLEQQPYAILYMNGFNVQINYQYFRVDAFACAYC